MADLIGLKNVLVRDDSILTTSYVAGTLLTDCEKFNSLILDFYFTKGSLTDCQVKIEMSMDGVNYYQLLTDSISAGVNSVANIVYKFTADLSGETNPITINTKYIKISAIGTGTVTGSSLKINAKLGKI